jgi:hypothetical protein
MKFIGALLFLAVSNHARAGEGSAARGCHEKKGLWARSKPMVVISPWPG